MSGNQMYLPCCRAYQGCGQHFPPGIAASHPRAVSENSSFKLTTALTKAVKFVARRKAGQLVQADKTGRILSLPTELLRYIASHLSLSSTAAFILSNRRICHAIGQESWVALRQPHSAAEKVTFLSLLKEDNRFWFCENCKTLHPRAFDKTSYYKNYDGFDYPFGYRLPSELVRMAIERAQKGPPHGMCTDRLSCAGIFKQPGFRLDYAYRVRVVGGQLFLRMDVRLRLEKARRLGAGGTQSPGLCSHRKRAPYIDELNWIQKIKSLLGRTYHHQADYPYAPQDGGGFGSGAADPAQRLLDELLPVGSLSGECWNGYSLCVYCFRVTRNESNADFDDKWDEDIARSYQIVGSGTPGDDKWMRSISPYSRLRNMRLRAFENNDACCRAPFETGKLYTFLPQPWYSIGSGRLDGFCFE